MHVWNSKYTAHVQMLGLCGVTLCLIVSVLSDSDNVHAILLYIIAERISTALNKGSILMMYVRTYVSVTIRNVVN